MPVIEPYRANEFVVEIGTVESPTVSKVTGLSLGETDTIEVVEGGSNVVRKVSSGVVKFQPITLERYVDGSGDDTLFKEFLPALQEAGFSSDEIQQLLVVNPREAFTIRARPARG